MNETRTFTAFDDTEFPTLDDRREYEAEKLKELLDAHGKWQEDYAEHEDNGAGYEFMIKENPWETAERIAKYLMEDYEPTSKGLFDPQAYRRRDTLARQTWRRGFREKLADKLAHEMLTDINFNPEMVRGNSEYYPPGASGCLLLFCADGEQETQIDVSGNPLLESLNERGELEEMLGQYNGDYHVHSWSTYGDSEKEKFLPGSADFQSITLIVSPGGAWAFYLLDAAIPELLTAAIIAHCRKTDRQRKGN